MFKLIKLADDLYALIGREVDFEGTKVEIIKKMVDLLALGSLEDSMEEISRGIKAVEIDDYAEYGIFGRFIFSSNFKLAAV